MDPYWCGLNHMQIPKSISVTRIRRHFDWPKPISCGLRCSGQRLASLLEASQVRGVRRGAIAQGGGCHCQKMVMRSAKLTKIIDVSSRLCIYMYIWVQATHKITHCTVSHPTHMAIPHTVKIALTSSPKDLNKKSCLWFHLWVMSINTLDLVSIFLIILNLELNDKCK